MSEKPNDDRYEEGYDWSKIELEPIKMVPLGRWKWVAISGGIITILGLILRAGYLLLGSLACVVVMYRQMLSVMPSKEYLHRRWTKDSYKLPKRIPIKVLSWLRWLFLGLFVASLTLFIVNTANLWLAVPVIVFFISFGLSHGDVTIAQARREIDESGEAPEVRLEELIE